MDNNLKTIDNEFLIEIENKKYYIYESYILNGTGYTLSIYSNSKHSRKRKNYFWRLSSAKIVILGKNNNFLLYKKNNNFEFDSIQFDKKTLRFDIVSLNTKKLYYIYLNGSVLFCYDENNNNIKVWNNEINNRNNNIRKQKLINLENA